MSISFKAILSNIEARTIIKLPMNSSEKLPSRGMIMVQGTMNGVSFIAPLEPDGKGSHWFELSDILLNETRVTLGQIVNVDLEPVNEWIEPEIPEDIMDGILKSGLMSQWDSLTTKARWEWLRWIRSTNNAATREKRINVACSKLQKGDRRPCCFDATRCTVADVSKSGVLLD
ncbi:MAG: uncharacterized protein K0S04_3271 [Herbinix sp.]|jgi:hypothetical protein|nr:uncharacterized protein [Herbinix sp.]